VAIPLVSSRPSCLRQKLKLRPCGHCQTGHMDTVPGQMSQTDMGRANRHQEIL
jgi:hypothetical protein